MAVGSTGVHALAGVLVYPQCCCVRTELHPGSSSSKPATSPSKAHLTPPHMRAPAGRLDSAAARRSGSYFTPISASSLGSSGVREESSMASTLQGGQGWEGKERQAAAAGSGGGGGPTPLASTTPLPISSLNAHQVF